MMVTVLDGFWGLLILHITFGFTALFAAFGAIASRKGQPWHRLFGTIFFYAMTGVFITAIPLALWKHNLFLFLIAFFSYYLAFSGRRYAKNRKGVPHKLDWGVSIVMLITSLCMLGFAISGFTPGESKTIILCVFGLIGLSFSLADLKTYQRHAATGKLRIVKHLGAMLGATIATLTAFSVTNIPIHPVIILWLGPTAIFVPVIIRWKFRVMKGAY